jgi:hypothetical protein
MRCPAKQTELYFKKSNGSSEDDLYFFTVAADPHTLFGQLKPPPEGYGGDIPGNLVGTHLPKPQSPPDKLFLVGKET